VKLILELCSNKNKIQKQAKYGARLENSTFHHETKQTQCTKKKIKTTIGTEDCKHVAY
jgi:hypothetical protein